MVEDTPDDLVHELFAESYWSGHALGRPILGTPDSVSSLDQDTLRRYFGDAYVASNFVVVAVGNLEHARVRALIEHAFGEGPIAGSPIPTSPPVVSSVVQIRQKELEQSHVCLGTIGLPQNHPDRYAAYPLNTVFGGSMSSRLFQNVRERGLAYAVFSSMSAFQDAGSLSIYAGCGNEASPSWDASSRSR
jgi:predicted Zn-dependent peptidase